MRVGSLLLVFFIAVAPALARHTPQLCGTTAETSSEALFLNRQSARARARAGLLPRLLAPSASRDVGDVAIIEDVDGVVARQNEFDLDNKTLRFTPANASASRYRYAVLDQGYDPAAAAQAVPLAALDDDDARAVDLPWSFPFFGANYSQLYVNSDGNLTFTASDTASSDRSLARMTSGPPRISPLFDDLDPSRTVGGVRVLSEAGRFVVSWMGVPEWQASGTGVLQTFQVVLHPDGRIEFSYLGVRPTSAVVGIAPGGIDARATLTDFRNDASAEYGGAVAERFGNSLAIDIITVAQKFYETHEDSYDYLVIYNNMNIDAAQGAVAYEATVRSTGSGFGVPPIDDGRWYGSASRLLAVLNMGQLSQYPADPNGVVPKRAAAGDTPLTTLGHEAGHLFLARASVRDPNDPAARPMLGFQNAHWSFLFNSEASLMEGERIVDRGPQASPRFVTGETVQGFAPLDQYLMGFRPPQDVPDTFLVTGPSFLQQAHPVSGFPLDGERRDITIGEIVEAMGRRTPDSTVAQRSFRFAFILATPQGANASAADLVKLEQFRQQFDAFFDRATTGNGSAQTSLRRVLKLSLSPAAGIVAGSSATAALTVQTAPGTPLTVYFQTPKGAAKFPTSVTIPAGTKSVSFSYTAVAEGVEEVAAIPADSSYESAHARVQVAGAGVLKLAAVSGDRQIANAAGPLPQPIVVRLTDENGLSYAGARLTATASTGGSVSPQSVAVGADGTAAFSWSPGSTGVNELRLSVEALPAVGLTIRAGGAIPVASAVVNAASFVSGVPAGGIGTIFGANLDEGRVLLNGNSVPVFYSSGTQINFYVPAATPPGSAMLSVLTRSGTATTASITVAAYQPGIFPGGVVHASTGANTTVSPIRPGDYLSIYCTGLGPIHALNGLQQTTVTPTVFFDAVPVQPAYSGLAPGGTGLYQVNVRVPAGLTLGMHRIVLTINQARSNEIPIGVQ